MGWGEGTFGRLGTDSDLCVDVTDPQVIESFQEASDLGLLKVLQVSCGENHSIAIVEMIEDVKKCLFVWGGNEKRQLGIDEEIDAIRVPHQLDPCQFKKDGLVPKHVVCGNGYSGVVTEEGVVYTWGSGEFGRLGYFDSRRQIIPRQVVDLKPNLITKLSFGSYHAAAICTKGQVFSWGRGNSGQLGCGNVISEDIVRKVTSLEGIIICDIACGDSHTVALSLDGEIYTWGGG